MNQTRRRPSIAAICALAVAAAAAIAVSTAPASVQAYTGEQVRYATETVNLPYEQFLARKADFKNQGCEQPPWQQQVPYFCHKPSPYNAFDWSDDGCSPPTPDSWKSLFNGPCQLHDFGYRNFGKGLSLGRNENTRSWIDNRFRIEMQRLCNNNFPHPWQYPNREACFNEAQIIWQGVRQGSFFPGGDWSQPLPPGVCCAPQPGPMPTWSPAPAPSPPPAPASASAAQRIAVVDTTGRFSAKEGALTANWEFEADGIQQASLSQ
jgi:hypothetical protein